MANMIWNTLRNKYFWRDWMVVVYSNIAGAENHWRKHCGESDGITIIKRGAQNNGYDFIVTSVPTEKTSNVYPKSTLASTKTREWKRYGRYWGLSYFNAQQIYQNLPSELQNGCQYPLVGVVVSKRGPTLYTVAIAAENARTAKVEIVGQQSCKPTGGRGNTKWICEDLNKYTIFALH